MYDSVKGRGMKPRLSNQGMHPGVAESIIQHDVPGRAVPRRLTPWLPRYSEGETRLVTIQSIPLQGYGLKEEIVELRGLIHQRAILRRSGMAGEWWGEMPPIDVIKCLS
ncbi:predicted protein [Histoplasma capsulatum G186AR]|uniref:Uncharacterized protein n=1 Tax=Ajellomyces capsulatus (strain G186AR / H82 / ATCC MYA-2454 / RMSCC 2432) TaxID=447093 RepID=C0NUV5_AJECG|nr:uncharacterized protein HCBG_06719 [Histoplasma capsulatum G186AR]EEH04768.1 predicted protein [Histoplasma capsulatum G186AR]